MDMTSSSTVASSNRRPPQLNPTLASPIRQPPQLSLHSQGPCDMALESALPGDAQSKVTAKRAKKVHQKVLGPLTPDTPVQDCRLLRLPPEIRRMIWKYAVTSGSGELQYLSSLNGLFTSTSTGGSTAWSRYEVPGIITTCHQIALETARLVLEVNQVVVWNVKDQIQFLRLLQTRPAVRKEGWMINLRCVSLGTGNKATGFR